VLLHTHPNTVLGRLLRISAFKTTGALRSLNDISRPGPDKPLRISAFGRFKVPVWVHLKTKEPFAFAGLWDVWRKPDGKRVESFTIITTEPNELVRPVHNRMPVILRPEDEEQWLDASRTPFVKAKSVLKPYLDELMEAHDVSPVVNSAKYDGPECIQPMSDDEMPNTGQLSLL
jgi:putative SOS response-associated peptidase YedK